MGVDRGKLLGAPAVAEQPLPECRAAEAVAATAFSAVERGEPRTAVMLRMLEENDALLVNLQASKVYWAVWITYRLDAETRADLTADEWGRQARSACEAGWEDYPSPRE